MKTMPTKQTRGRPILILVSCAENPNLLGFGHIKRRKAFNCKNYGGCQNDVAPFQGLGTRRMDVLPGASPRAILFRAFSPHTATMLISFLGTMMTFLMVLPARKACTFSDAFAAASSVALSALASTLMTSRNLPLTCTGISSVSSMRSAG